MISPTINIGVYVTPYELKRYLTESKNTRYPVTDEESLREACIGASRVLDNETNRFFYPLRETRVYDFPISRRTRIAARTALGGVSVSSPHYRLIEGRADQTLKLDGDLLEVFALTTGNGDKTISDQNFKLLKGPSYNITPFDKIEIVNATFSAERASNAIDGLWGHRVDWSPSKAFKLVGTVTGVLDATQTIVTVTMLPSFSLFGPSLQQFNLIVFGDDVSGEIAFVERIVSEKNEIQVIRGVNGTTPVALSAGANIHVYEPYGDVKTAAIPLAAYYYRRRFSVGKNEERTLASSTGILMLPSRTPDEVVRFIKKYKRSRIRVSGLLI